MRSFLFLVKPTLFYAIHSRFSVRFAVTGSLYFSLLSSLIFSPAAAASDCLGARLRICSQNLQRYSQPEQRKSSRKRSENKDETSYDRKRKQLDFLIARMKRAKCDVVAVQEVYGERSRDAERTIKEIASALSLVTGRSFRGSVGESEDPMIRNGFLVDGGALEIVSEASYLDEPLPRIQGRGQVGRFLRAPVEIVVRRRDNSAPAVSLLNIHYKSKAFGYKDRTGSGFEILRMEMAEATRRLIARRKQELPESTVMVVLGDRNSDLGTATAALMTGELRLKDFQDGSCRLDDPEQPPNCGDEAQGIRELLPLFTARSESFPGEYRGGSYQYRGRQEILDEVLVSPEDLERFQRAGGRFAIGFEGEFFKGSDHKLVWAEACL